LQSVILTIGKQVSSKHKTYAVSDDQRKLTVEEDFYAISITLRRKFTNQ